ncbi:molybdenum cofactor guanylyltransferase [Microbulbifer hydrolyticus]|uniref:Molybdopterin-guanine dinucleotide biosynthesis protein A n=1 Tax=Microbulbifer hydrolyticus TaxID=48074 RepID=A0A6P1TEH8_9GAMM|nr:molybdenum cofactor guanylyltransferase [Microbulbifer hydrolyticus]MBB5212408.1 molybdopterin-guanine dinucleotide biosynthesis protein A [Microbulbifer hydrolyticus]QHQ40043.1 NTP transferase domain-containing protein [Microbulbifer hydrolyticus]
MTANTELSSGQGRDAAGLKRVCPVVLAGGQSSRMGKDKALLKLSNGRTLLEQAKSVFDVLSPPEGVELMPTLVSGARPGGVPDRVPSAGPLGGLHAVAGHLDQWELPCDALLVVPVDMPLLSPALLRQLCVAGQTVEQAVCIGDFYLPCWLPLDGRCRKYLDAAATGNAIASMRALFGYLGCLQLPVPDGDWHLNVNRPEDFRRLAL